MECAYESERDVAARRVCSPAEVLGLAGEVTLPMRMTASAAHGITTRFDAAARPLLAGMLAQLAERPNMGITVEYDGAPRDVRKMLVPPYDVLYSVDEATGEVLVMGVVESLGTTKE